jgi:hypothetical protein
MFGRDPRMRSDPMKLSLHLLQRRCSGDDRPRHALAVEYEPGARLDTVEHQRLGADQADLLAHGEQTRDTRPRRLLRQFAQQRENDGAGGLIVGAKDCVTGAAHDAVLDHRLHRAADGDRVHVRADDDRRALAGAGDDDDDVATAGAGLRSGIVLDRVETGLPEIAENEVCDVTLATRRRRPASELQKDLEEAVYCCAHVSSSLPSRSHRSRVAAPTKSRKRGAGRVGRDLNSGWNCDATKNG